MPQNTVWCESYKAGADLRTHQYKVMELTADNTVTLANAAADRGFGILQNKPNTNEAAEVMHLGRSHAMVDGSGTAIAVGDFLGPNSSGVLVKKATDDYSICAQAMNAATAANVIIDVNLFPPTVFRTAAG